MELKATLNKPYTDKQRLDFIVTNNRQLGYQIKETDSALEAWGKTAEEIEQDTIAQQKREIMSQLDALDLKTISKNCYKEICMTMIRMMTLPICNS